MSQRPSSATRSTAAGVDVDARPGSPPSDLVARRGERQLAGVAGAEHAHGAAVAGHQLADLRGGGADVEELERRLSAAGRRAAAPRARARRRTRSRVDLDLGRVGVEPGDLVEAQRGERERAEGRRSARRPAAARRGARRRPRPCRSGSRRSRCRGCASCRARRRSRGSARPSARGRRRSAAADLAVRGRVEAQPLDRDLELVRPHRARWRRGARRAAAGRRAGRGPCRRRAAGGSPRRSLHERTFGNLCRERHVAVNGHDLNAKRRTGVCRSVRTDERSFGARLRAPRGRAARLAPP